MEIIAFLFLCSFAVGIVQSEVILDADMPFWRVKIYGSATLDCCYRGEPVPITWVKRVRSLNKTEEIHFVELSDLVTRRDNSSKAKKCDTLTIKSAQLSHSGLYQCLLNGSNFQIFTHGTYLQVYKPLEKTINIRESTKNKILIAEGILLLMCVLLPSATLMCKSKRLNDLQRKKVKKEQENIYQGLNLDDCCVTYDQIERSQAHGPYQDVGSFMEEEEIQLEKP